MTVRFLGLFMALSLSLSSAFAAAPVAADDALIIVGNLEGTGSISQQVNARIALSASAQMLKPHYSSVDVLDSPAISEASILAAVQKRKSASHVDVFVLSTSVTGSLKSRRLSNLRLVYLGGRTAAHALQDFRNLGAEFAIAQSDFTATSGLSATRFIRRWGEGVDAQAAAEDADQFASKVEKTLGEFAQASGAASLSMSGTNIDRKGGSFSQVSKAAAPQAFLLEKAASAAVFRKTPYQAAAVAASNALLPSVEVNADAVPNVGALVDRMQPMAWEQLQNVFTNTNSQAPSTETDPLAQEIWVDGEFLKFMATPLQTWAGGKYAQAIQYLQGVKLTRADGHLELSVYFSQAFDISVQDEAKAANLQLYAVHVPKTVRVQISNVTQKITISGLDDTEGEAQDKFFISVKIPVVSNKIYLRSASIDISNGNVLAEAGVLGDTVSLIATAQIFAAQPKPKVDLWQSIKDNEDLFDWPYLLFEKEL